MCYEVEDYLVEYRVDGEWTALSGKAPHNATLTLTPGEHVITANVLSSDGYLLVSKDKVVNADEKLNTNASASSGTFGFGRILLVLVIVFLVYKAIKKLVE